MGDEDAACPDFRFAPNGPCHYCFCSERLLHHILQKGSGYTLASGFRQAGTRGESADVCRWHSLFRRPGDGGARCTQYINAKEVLTWLVLILSFGLLHWGRYSHSAAFC